MLPELARQLAEQLAATRTHLVFAESCTAGLASAALAAVPGISTWHCGSAVTYREQTKIDWLGVSATDIARASAVSGVVAEQMAVGALERTAEAELAVSVTGHLGPAAPEGFDGLVFVGTARRTHGQVKCEPVVRHQLKASGRVERQREAAGLLMRAALDALRGSNY
jgi:PncC family amidohydrolase